MDARLAAARTALLAATSAYIAFPTSPTHEDALLLASATLAILRSQQRASQPVPISRPDECSACGEQLTPDELESNWGRCESCL
jgi:hypothetical protein